MDTFIWIIVGLLVAKVVLKATMPYLNKSIDEKVKEYWENLKSYF